MNGWLLTIGLCEAVGLGCLTWALDTERRLRRSYQDSYRRLVGANVRLAADARNAGLPVAAPPLERIDELMDELDVWRSRESRA